VVTGEESSAVAKGSPYAVERGYVATRVTRTWIRRHGTWQCVAFQTMVVASGEDKPDSHHAARLPAPELDRPEPVRQPEPVGKVRSHPRPSQ
jgi:hypothetical protein